MRLKKPTIIFLGGSSGIGRELIKFFNNKYQVIVFYNKNKPKVLKKCKTIKMDFNNDKELNSFSKKINLKNSRIILVNLSSIKIDKISLFINENELKKTFKINTFAFLKIIQILLPNMMKNNWGRIINVSSTGGSLGDKGTLLYSSSKNATESIMKIMSKEYGKFNITFNTLKLGNFNFGLFKKLNKSLRDEILKKIPSQKTGNIRNIYNALEFLVKSEYVNGSSINIDGGMN